MWFKSKESQELKGISIVDVVIDMEIIFILKPGCPMCDVFKKDSLDNHLESLRTSGYQVRYIEDFRSLSQSVNHAFLYVPNIILIDQNRPSYSILFNDIKNQHRRNIFSLAEIVSWLKENEV